MTISSKERTALESCADLPALPRAYGRPCGSGVIRSLPGDFRVTEFSGIEPAGTGEHLWIRVRKTGQNTRWVARALAEYLDLPYKAVSFAGMKDRHAVTEQWLSAHMPGKPDPDMGAHGIDGVEVLESARHNHKLRPGQLSYNRFRIVLRNCEVPDLAVLEKRVACIAEHGIPNYFGAQRFGRQGANLLMARDIEGFRSLGREGRGFFLSSVRGALFNGFLAERINDGCWNTFIKGEVELSDRPRGAAEGDQTVFRSTRQPNGLLWGKGNNAALAAALERENRFFAAFPGTTALLEAAGSRLSRRVLRAQVAELRFEQHDDGVELEFALGPGVFATVVLRELFEFDDRTQGKKPE
ncbi:MAG: tRNA pseudouridine(13) synthase TruD [Chromatiales bacterium]|nr:tRNA pseudouridine(13) synthase TruD [Chromatiales bacterium]MDP6149632.1 tRNA pseudouridine(13) synthase TruD [Gammaproteobacteria bacterium]MDP7093688.1 tRNA pseudouridine(13) synthase TruD [Gammaproteobacteria bacterium]MDP7271247.1 tRNA pseudouridine(13) synthase TruD [Gammaproteobacteria bacterium]HJP03702.1 tRNA pseudouridine(13) synthase TruD [Gammaproteobacteria bacterium]